MSESKATEQLSIPVDIELRELADQSNSIKKKLPNKTDYMDDDENFIPSGEIWNKYGNIFKPDTHYEQYKTLPVGVYVVHNSPGGYFLKKMYDKYEFDYKIYGLEQNLINRIIKTFNNTTSNIGALFNGLKGTGKTVTSKQLCNHLNLMMVAFMILLIISIKTLLYLLMNMRKYFKKMQICYLLWMELQTLITEECFY